MGLVGVRSSFVFEFVKECLDLFCVERFVVDSHLVYDASERAGIGRFPDEKLFVERVDVSLERRCLREFAVLIQLDRFACSVICCRQMCPNICRDKCAVGGLISGCCRLHVENKILRFVVEEQLKSAFAAAVTNHAVPSRADIFAQYPCREGERV